MAKKSRGSRTSETSPSQRFELSAGESLKRACVNLAGGRGHLLPLSERARVEVYLSDLARPSLSSSHDHVLQRQSGNWYDSRKGDSHD